MAIKIRKGEKVMNSKLKLFPALLLMLMFTFVTACSSDDDTYVPTTEPSGDSYYVKYEYKVEDGYLGAAHNIVIKDVDGEKIIQANRKWEGTYGPFKKGDKVYMKGSSNLGCRSSGKISVCKNSEPFSIKAEKTKLLKLELSYTIDY